jgi:cytochrome c peroxidase
MISSLTIIRAVKICLGVSLLGQAVAAPNSTLVLSAPEVKKVLRHGPWPPVLTSDKFTDAGNEISTSSVAIALGRQLFFDKKLSPTQNVSCATCHLPGKAFSDGVAQSKGLDGLPLFRNSPSLLNARYERWYGWDGAADSIWAQSLRPLLDPREMGSSVDFIKNRVVATVSISRKYIDVFAAQPSSQTAELVSVNVAKAMGAFVASLVSGNTPFDDFRNALERGDTAAASMYSVSAQRGLQIFIGKGECSTCHVGPMFSNGEFGDTGVGFFIKPGLVDPGRHQGIQELRASRFNLLSNYSSAGPLDRQKTSLVTPQHRNFGEFKVPSLRNVAQTAPYMHNGSLATLEAVVAHYSNLNLDRLHADGDQILKPLNLAPNEMADMVMFLQTLSTPVKPKKGLQTSAR